MNTLRRLALPLLPALAWLMLCEAAQGQVFVHSNIRPDKEVSIASDGTKRPSGPYPENVIYWGTTSSPVRVWRTLISFTPPAYVPGTHVTEARMDIESLWVAGKPTTMQIVQVSGNWDYSSITWAGQPQPVGPALATVSPWAFLLELTDPAGVLNAVLDDCYMGERPVSFLIRYTDEAPDYGYSNAISTLFGASPIRLSYKIIPEPSALQAYCMTIAGWLAVRWGFTRRR